MKVFTGIVVRATWYRCNPLPLFHRVLLSLNSMNNCHVELFWLSTCVLLRMKQYPVNTTYNNSISSMYDPESPKVTMHWRMHDGPACPPTTTQIWPQLTYTERDYMILLLLIKNAFLHGDKVKQTYEVNSLWYFR